MAETAQAAAAHPLLPGVITPDPDDDEDDDGAPVMTQRRRQIASAAQTPTLSSSTPAAAQSIDDKDIDGVPVAVAELTEGDLVLLEIDGEDVRAEVQGLIENETEPGQIEVEYLIVDDEHPNVGDMGSVELDERDELPRL